MPCPTCEHTLQAIDSNWLWCARCGTLPKNFSDYSDAGIPYLVERCRKFEATLGPAGLALWRKLGIEESIKTPEQRRIQGGG